MKKYYPFIILTFITSLLYSQTDVYHINHTRPKFNDSQLYHLPDLQRENYQIPFTTIDNLKGIERIKANEIVSFDF